jgi:hypothetical protein
LKTKQAKRKEKAPTTGGQFIWAVLAFVVAESMHGPTYKVPFLAMVDR